jgi:hypothetical protein
MRNCALATTLLGVILCGCGRGIVGSHNADVALRCASVVSNTTSGIVVRFRPVAALKGSITPDMLSTDGLLDFSEELGSDVSVPRYYRVYLKKRHERTGRYKNAPFRLMYDFMLINDDQKTGCTERRDRVSVDNGTPWARRR